MADRRQREEDLEQLTAYLDGELSEAQRAEVERLIANDPQAAHLLDELRRTSQRVSALPRAAAPADLATRIADRLEREALLGDADALEGASRKPLRWLRPLSLAAGFVLIVTAGWLLWPQRPEARPPAGAPLGLVQADRALSPKANDYAVERRMGGSPTKLGELKDKGPEKELLAMAKKEKSRDKVAEALAEQPAVPGALSLVQASPTSQARKELDRRTLFRGPRPTDADLSVKQDEWAVLRDRIFAPRNSAPTTTAPTTSAPTTTSAPATSQTTTRSAP